MGESGSCRAARDIFALRQKRYSDFVGAILRFAQRYICFANVVVTTCGRYCSGAPTIRPPARKYNCERTRAIHNFPLSSFNFQLKKLSAFHFQLSTHLHVVEDDASFAKRLHRHCISRRFVVSLNLRKCVKSVSHIRKEWGK